MPFAYAGKLLRVDLTTGECSDVPLDEATLRQYVGGTALGAKLLYEEVPAGVEWHDAENRVFIGSGPLGGTIVHGSGAISVVTKGAMTGGASSTQANGYLGAYLKSNGYDGLILQGAAPRLVYLHLQDGAATLKDATHLAGLDTWQTEDMIKQELGLREHQMSVFGIGPAGENLVRFAVLVGDRGHVAAHNGVGAVLGSKKLKAIAVARGKATVKVKDAKALAAANREFLELVKADPVWGRVYRDGMLQGIVEGNKTNTLPVRNYTTNIFDIDEEKVNTFTAQYIRGHFEPKPHPCWACQMHHCHIIKITEGPYAGYVAEEPEAESLAAWGPLIDNTDVASMVMLSSVVDRFGLDTNESGWVVAFVMECYEKGLISKEMAGGLEMTWGNCEAAKDMLRKIACREGIGDLLAEGVMRAAGRIGGEAPNMAVHTLKGNTPRSHDHRSRPWVELFDTCVSDTGTIEADPVARPAQLGIPAVSEPFNGEQVSSFVSKSLGSMQVLDSLGTCKFCVRTVPPLVMRLLNAATGWNFTWEEAMHVGRRAVNLFRLFNLRHGITPELDRPSPRYASVPSDGPAKGISPMAVWDKMLDSHYGMMGWDRATGRPLPSTLRELGLEHTIAETWGDR